jgi:hypothetical protein
VSGDSTIWSIDSPSSRTWIRIVWVPLCAKRTTGPRTPLPQPLSCHPHPDNPHPPHASRFTSVADVVPIRQTAAPLAVTASENCTKTESLAYEFRYAMPRIQSRYAVFASAANAISK